MLTKAVCDITKLTIGMFGKQGSGKTFSALLIAEGIAARRGGRVALLSTERTGDGLYTKDVEERTAHPAAFDYDRLYTRSLAKGIELLEWMIAESKKPKGVRYSVLIVDNMTHLWEAAQASYDGPKNSNGALPINAWRIIKGPYKRFMQLLEDAPFDYIILAREKTIFEEVGGELKKIGTGMKAEGETEYEPQISLHLEQKKAPEDPTISTYFCYVEKDRSGLLSGRTLKNINFETIRPVMDLLAEGEMTPTEDPDEAALADAELAHQLAEKSRKKEEKSEALYTDYVEAIAKAELLADLGVLARDMKKKWRYLIDEHRQALEPLYTEKRRRLAEKNAPAEVK